MILFNLPQISGFQDLEAFYSVFVKRLAFGSGETAAFDFHAMNFFPPEALLSFVALSKLWRQTTGQPVAWHLENHESLCYLERMNVFSTCADCIVPPALPSELWSRTSSSNLMEVQPVSHDLEQNNMIDVPRILASIINLLLGRVSPADLSAVGTLLSEVVQNVIHSGSQGFALSQIYHAGRGYRVHVGVADLGIGIPTSLKTKYPDVGHPSDYLRKALEVGVTAGTAGNGLGLYQVQQIIRDGQGTLTIRSDTAMLQLYNGRFYHRDNLARIPGTQVFLTIWGHHDPGKWNYLLPQL